MQQPSAPLLDNAVQPIAQGHVVIQTQDPYASGNMYGAQNQGAATTGYTQGNMYSAPSNAAAPANAAVAQPDGKYNPSDQQLGEGISFEPIIVTQSNATIQVEGVLQDGVGCAEGCARNPHTGTWILTIAVWFLFASLLTCNVAFPSKEGFCGFFSSSDTIGAALGITGVVIVIYWIECCCAGTGKYLRNVLQNEGAAQFVERVKGQPAEIWWRVACYHWETRTRQKRVTDKDGNTRTEWETYQEKVYTWRAREQYTYSTCIDVSGQLLGLDVYNLTKLKLSKTYGFADEDTRRDYVHRRRTFRMMNWRDIHQEFHEEFTIPGFVDRILAESEPGIKPDWMSNSIYWLCNLVFMSPCFRHKMSAACGNADYQFIKQISVY